MRKAVIAIAALLGTLLYIELWLTVISAVRKGQAFYGVNYWGLDLGTYSTLAVLIVGTAIGVYAGRRWLVRRLNRRSTGPSG